MASICTFHCSLHHFFFFFLWVKLVKLKKILQRALIEVGSYNSPFFELQCFHWHLFPSPIDVGSFNSPPCVYPLCGSASMLTHHSVSDTATICNGLNPPLADIVFFQLSVEGKRSFHTLIKNVFRSPPQPIRDLILNIYATLNFILIEFYT